MHVFQIKGFSGLLMLFLAIMGVIALFVLLPTAFVMVLWNATVFEIIQGPEIHLGQSVLLWLAILIALQLVFKPQISLQFKKVSNTADMEHQMREMKKRDSNDLND